MAAVERRMLALAIWTCCRWPAWRESDGLPLLSVSSTGRLPQLQAENGGFGKIAKNGQNGLTPVVQDSGIIFAYCSTRKRNSSTRRGRTADCRRSNARRNCTMCLLFRHSIGRNASFQAKTHSDENRQPFCSVFSPRLRVVADESTCRGF